MYANPKQVKVEILNIMRILTFILCKKFNYISEEKSPTSQVKYSHY